MNTYNKGVMKLPLKALTTAWYIHIHGQAIKYMRRYAPLFGVFLEPNIWRQCNLLSIDKMNQK